jgi:hypothetical protein
LGGNIEFLIEGRRRSDMFCWKCNHKNPDDVDVCTACGASLRGQEALTDEERVEIQRAVIKPEQMRVILLITLTLVTWGFYFPIWFLRIRKTINSLHTKEKLGPYFFMLLILVILINDVLNFAETFLSLPWTKEPKFYNFGMFVSTTGFVIIVGECFRIRYILQKHFARVGDPVHLSVLATFFFSIFYLQYKINHLSWSEESEEPRESYRIPEGVKQKLLSYLERHEIFEFTDVPEELVKELKSRFPGYLLVRTDIEAIEFTEISSDLSHQGFEFEPVDKKWKMQAYILYPKESELESWKT